MELWSGCVIAALGCGLLFHSTTLPLDHSTTLLTFVPLVVTRRKVLLTHPRVAPPPPPDPGV